MSEIPEIIRNAVDNKIPLIQLRGVVKVGTSAEIAAEVVNRSSDGLHAYYYERVKDELRIVTIQVHPQRAASEGVLVERVPLNSQYPDRGFKWREIDISPFREKFSHIFETVNLSQPGYHDDAQAYP